MTERQEVAEKLRAKYKERTMPGFFEPQDVYFQTLNYLEDLEECLPDGESAFTVLADLIDPTCHVVICGQSDKYHVCKTCSVCHFGWHEDIYDKDFSFYPHCGARVVSQDE